MKTDKRCSLAQFAKRHSVSKRTALNWRNAGYVAVGEDGLIDVDASDARLAGRPRKYRGGVMRGPAGDVADDEMQIAALNVALKRLLASGRKSGPLDELIDCVNSVLAEGVTS